MKLIEFSHVIPKTNGKSLSNETSMVAILPTEVRRIEKSRLRAQGQTITVVTVGYNKSFYIIANFSEILSEINKELKNDNT